MGIFNEYLPGHECYAVGYVVREGCRPDSTLLRELQYPRDDKDRHGVVKIGAACQCGWRSPYLIPSEPAEWAPYTVLLCTEDDERVRKLVEEHFEQERSEPHDSDS